MKIVKNVIFFTLFFVFADFIAIAFDYPGQAKFYAQLKSVFFCKICN